MIDYALLDDDLALLWAVNMGCIDMNAWASRVDRPDRPDWVIFDLDPSQDVGFPETIEVALLVQRDARRSSSSRASRRRPAPAGSTCSCRSPAATARTRRATFAGVVAAALARAHPGLATTEWTKSKRRGVLIDANQNGPGKTNAVVYSVARGAGAPVSTPLALGRAHASLDPRGVHDGRGARPRRPARRPLRTRAGAAAVARSRPALARLIVAPLAGRAAAGHGSSPAGCPRLDSSAMSRRKKSDVVQSATTRSLRRQERQRVEVVRARDEPAREARQVDPHHVRDALVAAERRDLPEHAVGVGPRVARQVLREAARLAQGVLAGRRVGLPRACGRSAPRRSRRATRRPGGPRRGASRRPGHAHGRRAEGRSRSAAARPSHRPSRPGCGSASRSRRRGRRLRRRSDADVSPTWISIPRRSSRRAAYSPRRRGTSGRIAGAASTSTHRWGVLRKPGSSAAPPARDR